MMVNRNRTSLRPEDVLEQCGPRFGEYPVSLLTRRAYSLQTDAVIHQREAAPNSVWIDVRTRPDGPDPARESP